MVRRASALLVFVLFAAGCGGGGGSGSGGSGNNPLPPAPQPQSAPPMLPQKTFGLAIFGDDGNSTGFLQIASLYDSSGKILATPSLKTVTVPSMFDLEDISIAPDGSCGIIDDGGHTIRALTSLSSGTPSALYELDVTPYGTDTDSVRVLPNGDEAVVSTDNNTALLEVSGLLSGKPVPAQTIPIPGDRNGLALSADGKVLLARGYSGLTVFSVAQSEPVKGALGGWTYHTFTQTQNLTTLPVLDASDARAGMAVSPKDSSTAAVVGGNASILFLTGLPSAANAQTLTISSAHDAYSVAISPDGTTAYVGTDEGIAVFSGVNTGSPTQTGSVTINTLGGDTVGNIVSLGVTPDGAYVVAVGQSTLTPGYTNGYLAVLPVSGGTLGAPVGMLSGVVSPGDDQMVVQ